MRLSPLSVFFLCLVLAAPARWALAADPLKKPEDFRGLRWGVASTVQPGLVEAGRDGDIIHYALSGEKNELGGIPVRHVTYSFYKDQFYHAEIDYDGKDAFEAFQRALTAKYGPPDVVREKKDAKGQSYAVATWNWPGYAFIGNRHDKNSTKGRIFYFYAPLTDASARAQGIAPKPTAVPKPSTAQSPIPASLRRQPAPAKEEGLTATEGYTVRRGDCMERIARRFHLTEEAIRAVNPGLSDKTLKAGDTINLPAGAKAEPAATAATEKPSSAEDGEAESAPKARPKAEKAASGATTHTIQKGDILSKLSARYGVSTQAIVKANPGINPRSLQLGTTLKIPAKP